MKSNNNETFIKKELVDLLQDVIESSLKKENDGLEKRMQSFVSSRIVYIINNDTPVPLDSDKKVIVHLIPVSSFKHIEQVINLELVQKSNSLLFPLGSNYSDNRYNYHGYLTYNDYGYTQVFRNGCIETVSNRFYNNDNEIMYANDFEWFVIQQIREYINVLGGQKIKGPFYMFATFTGTEGFSLPKYSNSIFFNNGKIDHNKITLPKVRIENAENIESFMKHSFDVLWNAGGIPSSPSYTNGIWNRKQR